MSSTTTSTHFASPPAANLSSLPFGLIKAIFEQCDDYFTLHALRRTCKAFKKIIDNNPVFDKYLFRNRPLTNPALTPDELIEIRSLAQTEEDKAGDRNPWLLEGNPYVKVHPILSQFGWGLSDVYEDDYDDEDDDYMIYFDNPDLTMKDIPHVLNQCATCPPVSTLEIDLDLGKCTHFKGWPNPTHKPLRIFPGGPKMSSSAKKNRHKQQLVLVRDVIDRLHRFSEDLYQDFIDSIRCHECYVDDDEFVSCMEFEPGCPSVLIREDGLLHLAFGSQIASPPPPTNVPTAAPAAANLTLVDKSSASASESASLPTKEANGQSSNNVAEPQDEVSEVSRLLERISVLEALGGVEVKEATAEESRVLPSPSSSATTTASTGTRRYTCTVRPTVPGEPSGALRFGLSTTFAHSKRSTPTSATTSAPRLKTMRYLGALPAPAHSDAGAKEALPAKYANPMGLSAESAGVFVRRLRDGVYGAGR